MSPRTGIFFSRGRDGVAHETADDDRLLILHDDRGLRGALGDGDRAERARRRAALGDLFRQLEAHLVRVVDVRHDLDLRADVLARRGEPAEAEPAEPPAAPRHRQRRASPGMPPGESTAGVGLQRDVLADVDLGGDVVGGEDVRRGEHVGVAARRSALEHDAERRDRDAGAEEVRRCRRCPGRERRAPDPGARSGLGSRIELTGLRPP